MEISVDISADISDFESVNTDIPGFPRYFPISAQKLGKVSWFLKVIGERRCKFKTNKNI